MSYKFNEKYNRYDVTLYENGERVKSFSYSIEKYGKHAELMAEYSNITKQRLNNWFMIKDNYIILYCYYKPTDEYKEILIDKDDYDLVKNYYWSAKKDSNGQEYYAIAKFPGNKEKKLHRVIMDVNDPKQIVDHIHGNGLDNRRNNLRIVSSQQNSTNRVRVSESNVTTGITGIHISKGAYSATWRENGKSRHKTFSINKYGEEKAKQLAIEYREKMIKENNYLINEDK